MRKASVTFVAPIVFLATTTLVACSFRMRAGTDPNAPTNQGQNQPTTTSTTPAQPGQPVQAGTGQLARRPVGRGAATANPTTNPTTSPTGAPTTPPTPSGVPVVNAATPFGSGTADPSGYQGAIFFIPDGTTKMPALGSMQPNGLIFAKELNIASGAPAGFPGVDANKKENFAIRYEAPLVVETEADYDFRIVSDDGAILQIDGTPIVDNDGVKNAAAEKTGPVHLVKGTHRITVDYFQAKGNVALQVFCKKKGDTADKVCPTRL